MKSSRKARPPRLLALAGSRRWALAASASILVTATAGGSTFYWAGDNASNAWNATSGAGGTNWSSSGSSNQGTAGFPTAGDDVFFALQGAGNLSSVLAQSFSINSLNFNANVAGGITIASGAGSNALTIGAGGITDNGLSDETLSAPVHLGASQTWTNNTGNSLTISGVISDTTGNANALTIAGSGTTTFAGANTYTGDTTVYTGFLTLKGAGALASTNINLGAGTTLTLDNVSGASSNTRLSTATSFNSAGGNIIFNGNSTTQSAGTLNVLSGATLVSATDVGGGSSLTFGAGDVASITRVSGGTVLFVAGSNTTISLPNLTGLPAGGLTNSLIGGWAFTNSSTGGNANFATLDANSHVVPFANYAQLVASSTGQVPVPGPLIATNNVQYNATGNNTAELNASFTVNSLYMTGGSPLSGVSQPPASGSYYNGITFGTADAAFSNVLLTVASGGIISSGASGIAHYNNHTDIGNMAFIGNLFGDQTGFYVGDTGSITAGAGVSDLVVFTDSNLSLASTIIDNGGHLGLTKSGPGILDLSDGNAQNNKPVNNFSGAVTINQGVLLINAAGQLGTSGVVNFNGGELRTYAAITTAGTWTVGTQGGVFSYSGGGNSQMKNLITGVGGFTFYAREAGGGSGATITLSNTSGAGGGTNANYQGPTSFIFSYQDGLTGSGGNAVENIVFGAANQVPAGSRVILNTVEDLLGYPVTPNINTVGVDMGGFSQSFGSIEGNVNLKNFSAGTLTIGANNLSTTYTGIIGAGGGAGKLVKVGSGTQTLSGANAYTGTTSILGGTLLIGIPGTTTSSASLANTAVTVGDGTVTGTLGGNGTINGTVTVTSTGTLAPAMSPTTSNTLTIRNDLTLNAGASLTFNLGAVGSSDLVSLTGNGNTITINGTGTIPDIVNINPLAGFGVGSYTLLSQTAAGNISNTGGETFTVNANNNAFNYAVAVSGKLLVLTVTNGSPILTWTGATSNAWVSNASGPANWFGGGGTVYVNPDNVVFDDTLAGNSSIAVNSAGVTPNSVVFNSGSHNYTINGPGSIAIATNLTQQAGADVTINANVNTPVTRVTAGRLLIGSSNYTSTSRVDVSNAALVVNGTLNTPQVNINASSALTVGSGGSIGSATLTLGTNATATFNNATQATPSLTSSTGNVITLNGTAFSVAAATAYSGQFAGNGTIAHNSGHTLTLSGSSPSFSGTVSVTNSSTLVVSNTSGSATGTAPVNLTSGTLDGTGTVTGLVTVAAPSTLTGTGTYGSVGGVNLSGIIAPAGPSVFGTINVGAFTVNTGAKFNFDVSSSGSDFVIASGATSLSGTETFNIFLPTTITTGTYPLLTAPSITGSPTFVVTPSGPGLLANVGYTILKTPTQLILNIQGQSQTWTGATNSNWDFATSNWNVTDVNGTTIGTQYNDTNVVLFNDGGSNPHIVLAANVAPSAGMIFSNSQAGASYVLTSSPTASIGGPGGVTLNNTGTVELDGPNTFSGPAAINAGTLVISSDAAFGNDFGSLGVFPVSATPNAIVIANGATLATAATATSFTLNGNRGIGLGNTTGAGGTINVPTNIVLTYGGVIANLSSQSGILNKTGIGELDLAGVNTFTGGLNVNGGTVKLLTTAAAGTGPIAVSNANSTLVISSGGGTTSNNIALGSGTVLATASNSETLSGSVAVANAANVALDEFDPKAASPTNGRLNFNGPVTGTGVAIAVNGAPASSAPDAADGRDGIQFNGPTSTLTGTITVGPAAKAVLSTTTPSSSPAGTANIVLTGGTNTGGRTGTYSVLGLANNSGGNTAFSNNVSLSGTGQAYLNMLSGSGNTVALGGLSIGANQSLGVVSSGASQNTASFSSVTLAGGNATFMPGLIGNAAYPTPQNLNLGPIGQSTGGSGIIVNGTGTVTLTGADTYTGATAVTGGTLAINGTMAGTGITVTNAVLEGVGTVSSTAGVTLGDGSGSHGSAVIRAGTLATTGTFNIHGLSLHSEGAFQFEVNLTTASFSVLNITSGSLVLGAGVDPAAFDDLGTGNPSLTIGQVFPIVEVTGGGTLSGFFQDLPNGSNVSIDGDGFTIGYNVIPNEVTLTVSSTGPSPQLFTPGAVPEPSSLTAAISGFGFLLGLGRFRRRAA